MRVTMNNQADLIEWAEPRMGVEKGMMPSETVALGVLNADGGIEAVICLNAFYSSYASMHVASNGGRRWLSRKVLACVFGYAFIHRGLTRLNCLVPYHNIPIQVLSIKLGMRIEGVARCGANDGTDGVLFGMLAHECRWLPREMKEKAHG